MTSQKNRMLIEVANDTIFPWRHSFVLLCIYINSVVIKFYTCTSFPCCSVGKIPWDRPFVSWRHDCVVNHGGRNRNVNGSHDHGITIELRSIRFGVVFKLAAIILFMMTIVRIKHSQVYSDELEIHNGHREISVCTSETRKNSIVNSLIRISVGSRNGTSVRELLLFLLILVHENNKRLFVLRSSKFHIRILTTEGALL